MILAIDIGNTNIVIGCMTNNKTVFIERVSTNNIRTYFEYVILLKNIFESYNCSVDDVEGSIIASVVPDITEKIKNAIIKLTNKDVIIVSPGVKTGLSIKIDDPAQLGADLVVAAVAANAEYGAPNIVFDMGTATTVCVVDKDKNCIGAMIMPGVEVSLNALVGQTSQLPKINLEPPKKVVGVNTVEAMKSGIMNMTICGIDGVIDKVEEELGYKTTVIATGGISKKIVPHCTHKIIHDDELILKGLKIIYNKNKIG